MIENIKLLESLFPKADVKRFIPEEKKKEDARILKKKLSFEQEIQNIKEKLEALR